MSTRNTILYRKLFNNSQGLSLFRLNKWPESGPNKHFVASNAIFDTYTRKISRRQWFVYRNRLFLLLSKLNHTDQRKRASSFDNKWNWLSFPSAVWKGLPLSSFKLKDSVWPCKFGEIQIEIKKKRRSANKMWGETSLTDVSVCWQVNGNNTLRVIRLFYFAHSIVQLKGVNY